MPPTIRKSTTISTLGASAVPNALTRKNSAAIFITEIRPIRSAIGRPYRGLARCQIALGRPAHALGALDAADLARWLDRMGEGPARSAALGIPPNEAAALADLAAGRVSGSVVVTLDQP